MNHPPPSDRTHAKGVHPVVNPHLLVGACTEKCKTNPKKNARHRRATPIFNPHGSGGYAHEPKYAKRTQSQPGNYTKRTQFTPSPPSSRPDRAPKMRNEPNLPPHGPNPQNKPNFTPRAAQKCKTNPISPATDPWKTKKCETNPISPPTDPWKTKKCKTNPIPTGLKFQISDSPPIRRGVLCETNPESKRTPPACIHLFNPGLSAGVLQQPEFTKRTQLPYRMPLAGPHPPIYAKRTQFTAPRPKSAKQTQFHPARCPKMRNEPNSPRPTANRQKPKAASHETNPITTVP